jgi:hypothetical protein
MQTRSPLLQPFPRRTNLAGNNAHATSFEAWRAAHCRDAGDRGSRVLSMLATPDMPLPFDIDDDVAWRHHDLAKAQTLIRRPPAPGEVCVWLVPSEFRFASASNIGSWLNVAERRRARHYPNSAIGRRFGVARATLRLVLSHMFDCAPAEVGMADAPDERVIVTDPRGRGELGVDVAYSGIWIVIAVASAKIGLGLAVDSDDAAGPEAWAEAARIGQARAQLSTHAMGHAADWHGLVLPMPGEIRGIVAVDRPVESVLAFGWERPLDAVARAALR